MCGKMLKGQQSVKISHFKASWGFISYIAEKILNEISASEITLSLELSAAYNMISHSIAILIKRFGNRIRVEMNSKCRVVYWYPSKGCS